MHFFCVLCLFFYFSAQAQVKRYTFSQPKMGSPFTIILYANDSTTAHITAQQSFALVDSLNHIFSDYDESSELNQLSATAGTDSFVQVSPLLYQIILDSKKAGQKSSGTFDITIGPLSHLWRTARREKRFPTSKEIQQAKSKTGFEKVVIDTIYHRIKLTQKGMQLDLGGIAKGFIAQQVMKFLLAKNITSALIDAGGDIVCSNAPPQKSGWTIGINIPEQTDELLNKTITLQNKSVATSGDVYQYTIHNGKKYSHIIDLRTGYGVTFQRNVTVIANDGATADWLATACSILPVKKAKRLVRQYGADVIIATMKHQKVQMEISPGINSYWNKKVN